MARGTLDAVVVPCAEALAVLGELLGVDDGGELLMDLGYKVPHGSDLSALLAPMSEATGHLADSLANVLAAYDDGSYEDDSFLLKLGALADAVVKFANAASELAQRAETVFAGDADFLAHAPISELGRRLLDYLVVDYLRRERPRIAATLELLGVVHQSFVPEGDHNPDFYLIAVEWKRLPRWLVDPSGVLADEYAWGTAAFDDALLLERLGAMLWMLGVPATYPEQPEPVDPTEPPPAVQLELPLYAATIDVPPDGLTGIAVGTRVRRVENPADAQDAGLGIVAYGAGAAETELPLREGWGLTLTAALLTEGLTIALHPKTGPRLSATGSVSGTAGIALARHGDVLGPFVLLGDATATRVELAELSIGIGAAFDPDGDPDVGVELRLGDLALVVAAAEADGFLKAVLPSEPLTLSLDLVLGMSHKRGLYFAGGSELEYTFSLNERTGPLFVDSVKLALGLEEESLSLQVTATGGLELGPLAAMVQGIGLDTELVLGSPGNLGVAALSIGFKPPDGIRLTLSAGPVGGGGQLVLGRGFYAGELTLTLEKFVLRAAGILATRTPGGDALPAPGWSLMAVISGEFPPIQLGLGFTLNGLGGVLGLHRTAAVPALRVAARTGVLGDLLFGGTGPDNALERVASLAELFPISVGRHVFGPTAKIAWGPGAATLLTIDVALLFELPAPLRLLVMGRLRMALPRPSDAIVAINMDVFGVIDFEAREASVDARLFDSQIAGFTLTGEMAMRVRWGEEPTFALSIGGFHPRFAPPAGFPDLRRLALSLAEKPNLRLRLEGYLALTTATVQFGARLELFARAGGFTVEGLLYFDALVQFAPRFGFMVDMGAAIAIKYRSWELLSVRLELSLAGTNPWHARGVARFRILFIEISGEFDEQWGSEEIPPPPPPVNVGKLLRDALKERSAWNVELPPATGAFVALRAGANAVDGLLAHPLGTVAFVERVVPLGVSISRFGNATLAGGGGRVFVVKRVSYGTVTAAARTSEPVYEQFALGDFVDLTDEQRLSGPAFVRCEAGRRFGLARGEARDRGSLATTPMVREYATKYAGEEDAAISPAVGASAAAARISGAVRSREREGQAAPAPTGRPTPRGLTIVVPDRRYAAGAVSGTYAEAVVAAGRSDRRVHVVTA